MKKRRASFRAVASVVAVLTVCVTLSPVEVLAASPESEGVLALLCQVYESAKGQGDVDLGSELVGPDCVHRYPLDPDGTRGTEGQRQLFAWYMEAFPDTEFTVEEVQSEGSSVVVHWRSTGTHTGEFLGIAPTGIRFEGRGTSVSVSAGGLVLDSWVCWNVVELLQQLGVLD